MLEQELDHVLLVMGGCSLGAGAVKIPEQSQVGRHLERTLASRG